MGIQFKQVDGLDDTFNSLSGYLLNEITGLEVTGIASGTYVFSGDKIFLGNVTCSGSQGLGVEGDSLYDYGYAFVISGVQIGASIDTPRSNTTVPPAKLHVTGGESYFDGDVSIRNNANVVGTNISGTQLSGLTITASTGSFEQASGLTVTGVTGQFTTLQVSGITGGNTTFDQLSGNSVDATAISGLSGQLNTLNIIGNGSLGTETGYLRLHGIPSYEQTGTVAAPQSGTLFRSGNYLMII